MPVLKHRTTSWSCCKQPLVRIHVGPYIQTPCLDQKNYNVIVMLNVHDDCVFSLYVGSKSSSNSSLIICVGVKKI